MTKTIKLDPPREGSKLAALVKALTGKGRTMTVLSKRLAWQPHTVRAAMTRLRKRGYPIACDRTDGKPSIFRIAA